MLSTRTNIGTASFSAGVECSVISRALLGALKKKKEWEILSQRRPRKISRIERS
jgi:hypothetical protein